jgi:hypothetical protein
MSDPKIGTNANTGLRVQIDQSRTRQTADTSFGHVMSEGLTRTADAALEAGQLAAPFIPGGAVLSAAITGVGSLRSTVQGTTSNVSGAVTSPNSTAVGGAGTLAVGGGVVGDTGTSSGTLSTDPMLASKQLMEMNQSFNMQYLMLQQQMQDESRRYSVISNIMKTKHDTAKNSISNVR